MPDTTANDLVVLLKNNTLAIPSLDSAVLGLGGTLVQGKDLTVSLKADTGISDRYFSETGRVRIRVNF